MYFLDGVMQRNYLLILFNPPININNDFQKKCEIRSKKNVKNILIITITYKISAKNTSRECANCSHIHPDNRKSQNLFICENCGHTGNADENAAEVIKQRAIKLILDSGTELSARGVLVDTGRGAANKSLVTNVTKASGNETSKKKGKIVVLDAAIQYRKLAALAASSSHIYHMIDRLMFISKFIYYLL